MKVARKKDGEVMGWEEKLKDSGEGIERKEGKEQEKRMGK